MVGGVKNRKSTRGTVHMIASDNASIDIKIRDHCLIFYGMQWIHVCVEKDLSVHKMVYFAEGFVEKNNWYYNIQFLEFPIWIILAGSPDLNELITPSLYQGVWELMCKLILVIFAILMLKNVVCCK